MTGIRTFGIDISHYSEDIDWPTVINQKIHFSIAKASELYTNSSGQVAKAPDPYFPTYWKDMKANNVTCGAYHFCHPEIDPNDAMSMFFGIYTPQKGDLLPSLDIEDDYSSNTNVSTADKISQIQKMTDIVSSKIGGKRPIIYSKRSVWAAMGNPGNFGGCPLWVIDWQSKDNPTLPGSWNTFAIWQYAADQDLAGVKGNADFNFFNGTPAQLAACQI